MPYRRPDSPVWWVGFTDSSGRRVRRSTGTADKKQAEAIEAKWKLEAFREQHWDERPNRTFDELMVAYLQATVDKRSADKDRQRTKTLRTFFGGRIINDLGARDILAYTETRLQQSVSPSTINRELALLSAAINYANRAWDWRLPNRVKGHKLKEPEGRVRWITREEAERLIHAAEAVPRAPYLADIIRVALHTGCRVGELTGLEWRRVDWNNRLLYLEGMHTKAGRRRSVPLNRTALAALESRKSFRDETCPDSPWVFAATSGARVQSVRKSFTSACRAAGIEDFTFHDLRHTCAAWLVSSGAALAEVRDLLGHSTIAMTERYAHLAPDNVRRAVDGLDAA